MRLESSIRELHAMFMDMAMLVETQVRTNWLVLLGNSPLYQLRIRQINFVIRPQISQVELQQLVVSLFQVFYSNTWFLKCKDLLLFFVI